MTYLTFDIGTTALKTALISDDGRALAWTGRVKRVTEHESDPEGEHADVVRQVVHQAADVNVA